MKLAKALKFIGGVTVAAGIVLALGEWETEPLYHYVVAIGVAFIGYLLLRMGKGIERIEKI